MRSTIPFHEFVTPIFHQWDKGWFLLTSGDFAASDYNAMTVSWGAMGGLWGRPFVQVVVRPQRYTYGFMERYDTFTLSAFPETYRRALDLLGVKSGRDGDKIAESGLTPVTSTRVAAPSFAEAELVIECRKIYWDDLEPGHFLSSDIGRNYPIRDYHRVYYGEIVTIEGEDAYRR